MKGLTRQGLARPARIAAAAFTLSSLSTLAAAADFAPNWRPSLTLRPAAGEIRIDGLLDDPGWAGAAVAENFAESSPGDNSEPPVATRVLVTYDAEQLYLAFIAEDDSAEVRAGLRDRDAIWQDDYLGIILDTYADQAWAYELFVNPLGIQGDLRLVAGGGEDIGFDLVWTSEGRLTATGFQVEVAVPFASLLFPDAEEQVWRATFWRDRKRNFRERSTWAAVDRDEACWMCQFGTLRGIRAVKPGGGLSLLPAMIAHQGAGLANADDPDSPWQRGDSRADFGLGLAYTFGPNLAIEGAFNPDFSQVESDAAQIDVNTPFALFYEERRPFFQRGSNLFGSWINAIYTRSINDPYVAAKVTARRGPYELLLLSAQDERSPFILPFEESSRILLGGESLSNILRLRRSYAGSSFIGALLTDRRHGAEFDKHGLRLPADGGAGTVAGLDWALRFRDNWRWEFQALGSRTQEPVDSLLSVPLVAQNLRFDGGRYSAALDGERFLGHALYTSLERSGRRWNFDIDARQTSPAFRAENGFISTSNRRDLSGWMGWDFRPASRFVESVQPRFSVGGAWNYAGKQKDEWFVPAVDLNLLKQTHVELVQMWSAENYRGVQFDGIRRTSVEFSCNPSSAAQFGAELHWAHTIRRTAAPFLGRQRAVAGWASLRLGQRTVIWPSLEWTRMEHPDTGDEVFRGYVARTRLDLQFTRRLFLRAIVQYDDFDSAIDLEPLLSYKLSPFTVLYLGSAHHVLDYGGETGLAQAERQFFLKLQVLLQT
ncbi:carbohydrate binding family 9 domain-containing protein [bacterium]|nr:carbohydrate binding family 9 domain-containing protein [bacterium]